MKEKKFSVKWIVLALLIGIGLSLTFFMTNITPSKKQDYRPEYCRGEGDNMECIPKEVFQNLPPYPEDMDEIYNLVRYSFIQINEDFTKNIPDENYYKQPEFYPTWEKEGDNIEYYYKLSAFEKQGYYNPSYLGVQGFGCYPADVIVRNVEPTREVKVVQFMHTAYGVVNYQGFKLDKQFPTTGVTQMGKFQVEQNPGYVDNHFRVLIEPHHMLLEPSYFTFQPGWSQKITTTIKVSEHTEPGNYLIGIQAYPPSTEQNEEWFKELRFKYVSQGGFFQVAEPKCRIWLQVV